MNASDSDCLDQYARHGSETAFATLVQRHLNLVYSAALRQVRSPQLAEEVAQSVFTDLSRSASRLKPDTIVAAWLYQVTRRTAVDVVRREVRRQLREQIASEMNAMNADAVNWSHIEPLLDEGMDALDEADRSAILLRYFENKSLREVGALLGTSDDAAQKRVSRAVERLREFFSKRGVTTAAGGLVVALSANAVQAAPAGLAISISSAISATLVTTGAATKGSAAAKATGVAILTSAVVSQNIVATHFDLAGNPNGWMDRSTYLWSSLGFSIGLPLLLIAIGYLVRFIPPRFVNIPHRDYWLAPERRAATSDYLFRQMLWLACFEALFMVGLHLLVAQANRQAPPHLSSPLTWGLAGTYLATLGVWIALLYRRFKLSDASSSRRN